jgi:hypothetical protein
MLVYPLSVLVLADRGSFAFAVDSKLGVVALHCFWARRAC